MNNATLITIYTLAMFGFTVPAADPPKPEAKTPAKKAVSPWEHKTLAARVVQGDPQYDALFSQGWELFGYSMEPAWGGGANRPERWQTHFRRKSGGANNDARVTVFATLIEHPEDMTVTKEDWESGVLERRAGVTILRLPGLPTRSGDATSVRSVNSYDITLPFLLASGDLGLWTEPEFHVETTLDGDTVRFTAATAVREQRDAQPVAEGAMAELWGSHYFFSGRPRVGESVFYAPKRVHNGRRVCLALTSKRVSGL